mmetsp:Transcript_28174/g.43181  ORF Transcript_28174/g.43181 Transcript_28174/m.43181 type:complete len:133 (-) Transcript_28174:321-719(-)
MSQAMASPDPIPPPPPLSPDEAMDVFNPFGTFSCGTSGGFVSSDPFSPISNSRTPSMAQQKQQQSSDPFSPISSSRTPSAAMVQQKQQQQQQQQEEVTTLHPSIIISYNLLVGNYHPSLSMHNYVCIRVVVL